LRGIYEDRGLRSIALELYFHGLKRTLNRNRKETQ
jgi:hypothetical protein